MMLLGEQGRKAMEGDLSQDHVESKAIIAKVCFTIWKGAPADSPMKQGCADMDMPAFVQVCAFSRQRHHASSSPIRNHPHRLHRRRPYSTARVARLSILRSRPARSGGLHGRDRPHVPLKAAHSCTQQVRIFKVFTQKRTALAGWKRAPTRALVLASSNLEKENNKSLTDFGFLI